jgi:hypothetical protein
VSAPQLLGGRSTEAAERRRSLSLEADDNPVSILRNLNRELKAVYQAEVSGRDPGVVLEHQKVVEILR